MTEVSTAHGFCGMQKILKKIYSWWDVRGVSILGYREMKWTLQKHLNLLWRAAGTGSLFLAIVCGGATLDRNMDTVLNLASVRY